MTVDKKKVLVVSYSLQKAGSEKYVYELVKHFDKNLFDVEVLTTDDVYKNVVFPHFYFFKLRELGTKIHTILIPSKSNRFPFQNILEKTPIVARLINKIIIYNQSFKSKRHGRELTKLLKRYDAVILVDALYFKLLKSYLDKNVYFQTHLMCHQAQFNNLRNIYDSYDINVKYNFVYIDQLQVEELKKQNIRSKDLFYFPLSLDIPPEISSTYEKSAVFRIGVFTRINRIKPLEQIIEGFAHLVAIAKTDNYELLIFGHIQDRDYYEELSTLIKSKQLENKIFFAGHSENMVASVNENAISLVWVVSIFNFVGYAAIELCLNRVPIILSNIDNTSDHKPINDEQSIPPYFYDNHQLAIFTKNILQSDMLSVLLHKEIELYKTDNNIVVNIRKFENYLLNKIEL